MRFRRHARTAILGGALTILMSASTAAIAEHGDDHHAMRGPGMPPPPDMRPEWHEAPVAPGAYGLPPEARHRWLAECRRRMARSDDRVGGALIGGAAGGFLGNRIAGRGNRLAGTVAGAAVGAIAGAAIDKAEDRGRGRDDCEAYLDDYYAYYAASAPGYGYHGHRAGMAPGCCMPMAAPPGPRCTETVTYEYEYVPAPRRRVIHRGPKRVPAKRIRIAPDKRVQGS